MRCWNLFYFEENGLMEFNQAYWQSRYESGSTPWDIGHVSPPLKTYIDEQVDPAWKILVPGAGRAYEAAYLYEKGYHNVVVCDWAEAACNLFLEAVPSFPSSQVICSDFFGLTEKFDLILEQTFFCAIPPSLRKSYVNKSAELLNPSGRLAGLLFASHFAKSGPPFGGTKNEYMELFSERFEVLRFEVAENSILPRTQNEFFFEFIKK